MRGACRRQLEQRVERWPALLELQQRAVEAIIERAAAIGLRIKDNWQVFRFDYISRKAKRLVNTTGGRAIEQSEAYHAARGTIFYVKDRSAETL